MGEEVIVAVRPRQYHKYTPDLFLHLLTPDRFFFCFSRTQNAGGANESSEPTILIRGLKSAAYHVEAAEPTMARLREAGADATITGGGRIKHSRKRRSIFIYG